MAVAPTQSSSTSTGTPAKAQATERKPQSQLVSPEIAAATNGLAGSLEDSAKARIQYGQ